MPLLVEDKYLQLGEEIKAILGERELVLASTSPRRKQMLEELGIPFSQVASGLSEQLNSMAPEAYVQRFALQKVLKIAPKSKGEVVLGADTVVFLDGEIFGKPKNRQQAFRMLSKLSGKTHTVYTGVAAVNRLSGIKSARFQSTRVSFNRLSEEDIMKYLDTGEYADKAGAYGIQGMGSFLVQNIEGDLDNVIGLPLATVKQVLMETL